METILSIFIAVILFAFLVILTLYLLFMYTLLTKIMDSLKEPEVKYTSTTSTNTAFDQYTPESADRTVPLDEFHPNLKRPLRVVVKEEDENKITPLEKE